MHLEDYFDVLAPEDIRIKGTRIGIETVLYDYIHRSRTPEQIASSYPTLTLEQVYATILHYLRNREAVDAYVTVWLEFGHRMRVEQAQDPAVQGFLKRLRRVGAAREGQPAPATVGEQA